jgi:phenylpropionate dioxygenase-like ring-hydroxylating dioxygenase large terminal subunit
VKVPFTWKVTGWFMVGWSPEFPMGETRPLKYFGEDLVAYRDQSGELHVVEAHCKHLGAHLGHGGKVVGDCVECPFHGRRWGSIWESRVPGDESDVPPDSIRKRIEKQFLVTVWDDLEILRYQKYVEHPALAKADAKPYMAMRKWAMQFADVTPA